MPKINPFQPNSPVPSGMFAGRYDEILELEKGVFQTKNGHPSHHLITGERGIGKSSLLMYLKHVSCGDLDSFKHGSFNFLTIQTVLSEKTNLVTLIKLIERNISREVSKVEKVRSFISETWSFVQRIKVMDSGISVSEKNAEEDILIDDFSYSLAKTCNRLIKPENGEQRKDGIIFIIDEADNANT